MADANLVLWGAAADAGAWHGNAAGGSSARLSVDGDALRVDFTLRGHGAWAIARRDLAAALPAHYVAVLAVRGSTDQPLELQVKLVDPSGANVWWWRRRDFTPQAQRREMALRKASLEFAWGPASGGEPTRIAAVEIGLAGGDRDVSGTLWIDALRIEPRDPASTHPRVQSVRASSAAPDHPPSNVLTATGEGGGGADADRTWGPAPGDAEPWLELDLGARCEFGGVVVDGTDNVPACRLLTSDDGTRWTQLAEAMASDARRTWLRTDDGEARLARVQFAAGSAPQVVHADVVPLELAVSPARFIAAAAGRAPRGRFPRHLLGEQIYWALAGGDGDERKGLLSEDGALEVDAESFTLEPFLWVDGRLLTWADVETSVALADGHLPIPVVEWRALDLRLRITACASGAAGASALVVSYAIENARATQRAVRLFVAIRPFQVNPAWQALNIVGGVAPITRIECDGASVRVNDARRVLAVTKPDAAGAAASHDGLAALADGRVPPAQRVDDPIGFAEAAFAFDMELPAALDPGAARRRRRGAVQVALAVPLFDATPAPPQGLDRTAAATWADGRTVAAIAHWQSRFAALPIELPAGAAAFTDTLRASLAWVMVNREGPRIQPGPRCYRRSWIRDGTLTGTALVEMGFPDEARAFLRWYAPFQLPDGRVPCAVDRHGIDHAVEHDSHGQLAWGVVEVFRLTGDREFLAELWPHVLRAVDAIAALRAQRTTDAYRGTAFFGLLPESISHEGYASHPVHSYWDDFFAVRGLADAAAAASVLGDAQAAQRIGALRDAMRTDLQASIVHALSDHAIDFIPGSADLGDFDPTSTAIAFDPCAEAGRLPADALGRTFERYWLEFEARRSGDHPAEAYTPYEIRTAAAFVMLGQKQRALSLLGWLIGDQRPTRWRQWPEVAWRNQRAPRFIGDLPHGWIASSFARTVRRMIAYEHPDDGTLVLAAGVPEAWVREAPGVWVRALPTHFGLLDYTMCANGDDRVRVEIGGSAHPPAGFVIMSPFDRPLRAALIDGRDSPVEPQRVAVPRAADVELIY